MTTFTRHQFQIDDLEFFKGLSASANFSSMGCFKSSTCLFLAQDIKAERVLILTSKTGKVPYYESVPAVLPGLRHYDITSRAVPEELGHTGFRRKRGDGIFLAHYNLLTRKSQIAKDLRSTDFDLIIMDESHRIKSNKSQCGQIARYLKAPVKHIMTGSPFVNNPADLWGQVKAIVPPSYKLGGYWAFSDRFCEYDQELLQRGFRKVIGVKDRDVLRKWLHSFARWHTLEEIMPDLPGKIPSHVDVELNATQRRMYDEIKSELLAYDQAGYPLHAPNVLAGLARLRQITSATPQVNRRYWDESIEGWRYDISLVEPSSKLDALMDKLDDTNDQVVIFYTHKDVGKLLNARLDRANVPYINMLQRHNELQRAELVKAFQGGAAKVFHSTIALGSESITLTAANHVLFIDRDWTPKSNDQAEDRVRRPGQTRTVHVIDFRGRGTTDGYVRNKVETKRSWFKSVFDNEVAESMW